jgi:hypothetical protein
MHRNIIAIDPGPVQSALLWLSEGEPTGRSEGSVLTQNIWHNDNALELLKTMINNTAPDVISIEMVASYGMAVGAEVFDTCYWAGRFAELAHRWRVPVLLVYRKDVKMHLCHSMRAKDSNIRQALIDRFGPGKEKAIGTKDNRGPCYGIRKDIWSALAVAVYTLDTLTDEQLAEINKPYSQNGSTG